MLRRNAFFILGVVVLLAIAVTGAFAQLTDPEVMSDSTFTAGSLDLTVDGDNGTITASLSADNMDPMLGDDADTFGDLGFDQESAGAAEYNAGCVELKNEGSLPGRLAVLVHNPWSHENGLLEPESDAGDVGGTEVDPTSYDANGGHGELWDQITFQFCIDNSANGECDTWPPGELIYSNYGTPSSDYTSYYSLPLDTDLASGDGIDIGPGESVQFCVDAVWVGDTTNWWWGGHSGFTNNMAMSDDVTFDIEFVLYQYE